MRRSFLIPLILIAVLVVPSLGRQYDLIAQQPATDKGKPDVTPKTQSAPQRASEETVRISVTLVQVDVSVTDSKGRPVTDLKPEDFEVFENGRAQTITNFSYVSSSSPRLGGPSVTPTKKATEKNAEIPAPPVPLRPDQVRRTIALVVDDLALSIESTPYVRQALKKYVDEQMQPGDLVAIIRTGAGMGALQMFTADKRLLYAAIERVRWSPSSSTLNAFAPVTNNRVEPNKTPRTGDFRPTDDNPRTALPQRVTDDLNRFREEVFTIGTLGALSFLIRGLRELPGRKSIVLFSDGLRMHERDKGFVRVQDALRNLSELANRSSVVIYAIDARGVQPLMTTAADDLAGDFADMNTRSDELSWLGKSEAYNAKRGRDFLESQEGLAYLAQQTGGLFVKNNNDLSGGIKRVLNDQDSYYWIGFAPDPSTFKGDKRAAFNEIKVKVRRPGVRVRTRSGFFGFTDEEARSPSKTSSQSLLTALSSPFSAGEIPLRLTSLLGYDPQKGAFVSSLLHIDAKNLTFTEESNGQRKVAFEIAAFTFGDNGSVVDQSVRGYTVRMTPKQYERTLRAGIFYRINLPIKKAGAYQLRTAVRDTKSLRLGSANQLVEVPDLKSGRLVLSGMILQGADSLRADASGATPGATAAAQAASTSEGKVDEVDPESGPAVRRFKRGTPVDYAYIIYNPRTDKSTRQPQLQTQVRLFHDGEMVFNGEVKPFDLSQQKDPSRLFGGGRLLLGKELAPGEYAIQVIVSDSLARENQRTTTQWIDFDIVE